MFVWFWVVICLCVLVETYRVMLYDVCYLWGVVFVCCSCWCDCVLCVVCGLLRDVVWFVFCECVLVLNVCLRL